MRCPTCNETTYYEGNRCRPFCSERCKLIDLGKWASGVYRVPSREVATEETVDSFRDGRDDQ